MSSEKAPQTPYWSQWLTLAVLIGSGTLSATLLLGGHFEPIAIGIYAFFLVCLFWVVVRLLYASRIRSREVAVLRVSPNSIVIVSMALSARANIQKAQFLEPRGNWAVVSVDAFGVRVWPPARGASLTLAWAANQGHEDALSYNRGGPIVFNCLDADGPIGLFPVTYRWGEYFPMSDEELQHLAESIRDHVSA